MRNRYEEDDLDVLGELLWAVLRVAALVLGMVLVFWLSWVLL